MVRSLTHPERRVYGTTNNRWRKDKGKMYARVKDCA